MANTLRNISKVWTFPSHGPDCFDVSLTRIKVMPNPRNMAGVKGSPNSAQANIIVTSGGSRSQR
jgi:hypothetical protein